MSKIAKVGSGEVEGYEFKCPGCGGHHVFYTKYRGKKQFEWVFNGNLDKPTFAPSLKNTRDRPSGGKQKVCHLFVRDGQIEYCSDSTHSLAGKTVPMEEL